MQSSKRIRPVILSGGSGTRLWPLSTDAKPKQFLALVADRSMFQLTVQRVQRRDSFESPVIVGSIRHRDLIEQQLAEIGAEDSAIILEPAPRNTAAAIALAALASAPDETLLVMPSDHVIDDAEAFHAAVTAALPAARNGFLVTFGISPDRPEVGYGYIKQGEALISNAHRVDAFIEKPDVATARDFVERGCFLWNGGIFLFQASDFIAAMADHAPDVLDAAGKAMAARAEEGNCLFPEASSFSRSPAISIDYAVMEKARNVAVVPLDAGWSDLGSWDALFDHAMKDESGNVMTGDVHQIESYGCHIRTEGPLVAAVGVNDLIVLATRDHVLIVPRGQAQKVKAVVELLSLNRPDRK
jgi:mannose-1-phosphate guanylyltransferase/mannose-1-phosphate guanylyltransferase/mannose-6-phosphate isomerase